MGLTHHLTNNKDWFSDYVPLETLVKARFENNGAKKALENAKVSFIIVEDKQFKIANFY